jgi:uncharacterized RDD family membrane protein YckC
MFDEDSGASARAGVWRRGFAIAIDILAASFVAGLLGLLLFGPTDGRIRAESLGFKLTHCSPWPVNLSEFRIPNDFRVTNTALCTSSFLGQVHDRMLIVAEVSQSGAVTHTRSLKYPIDAGGHPIRAVYVDHLSVFLLAAYLILLEWRYGQTLGKGILGIRAKSLTGGPLTFIQAAKRTAIRCIPAYPLMLGYLAAMLGVTQYSLAFLGICALLFAVMAWNFIASARLGDLAWHDRWAGTEVIRLTGTTRSPN